jgi:glycosyltransferase involved in cell wall biosynthesis
MADICVIPLRLARGVQNKVLESMAMGRAVVTTSKANEGIQAADGKHLLVADSAEGFADAVTALVRSPQHRSLLGKSAREFVVDRYDWATNMDKLESLLC